MERLQSMFFLKLIPLLLSGKIKVNQLRQFEIHEVALNFGKLPTTMEYAGGCLDRVEGHGDFLAARMTTKYFGYCK